MKRLAYSRRRLGWTDCAYRSDLTHREELEAVVHAALTEFRPAYTDGLIAECRSRTACRWARPRSDATVRRVCTDPLRDCGYRNDDAWQGPALQLKDAEQDPTASHKLRRFVKESIHAGAFREDTVGATARAVLSGDWSHIDGGKRTAKALQRREDATCEMLDWIAKRVRSHHYANLAKRSAQ
jgi:hypothetical protein